jgi:hypothetical protein
VPVVWRAERKVTKGSRSREDESGEVIGIPTDDKVLNGIY